MSTFSEILADETLGRLFGPQVDQAWAAEIHRIAALAPLLPRRLEVPCAVCGQADCDVRVWRVS